MTKSRSGLYHVVRFNTKRNPDLVAWFKAQKSDSMSLAQLIRLAQALGGNKDWLNVAPFIEGKLLKVGTIPTKATKKTAPKYSTDTVESASKPNNSILRRKTSLTSNVDTQSNDSSDSKPKSKAKLDFGKNGIYGL